MTKDLLKKLKISYDISNKEVLSNPEHFHPHWESLHGNFNKYFKNPDMWKNFRNNQISVGLDDSNLLRRQKTNENLEIRKTKIIEQYNQLSNIIDPDLFEYIEEPNIGNPFTINVNGHLVNEAVIDHLYFANVIKKYFSNELNISSKINIVEIGGGYGGLARILKKIYPDSNIILFDLPPTNVISEFFLKNCFPDYSFQNLEKIKFNKGSLNLDYDFTILPGWYFDILNDKSIDLIINIRSFMEMEMSVVNNYLNNAKDKLKNNGLFYCVNRYEKYKKSWGKKRKFKLIDINYGRRWRLYKCSKLWRQPYIWELLLRKIEFINPISIPFAIKYYVLKSKLFSKNVK